MKYIVENKKRKARKKNNPRMEPNKRMLNQTTDGNLKLLGATTNPRFLYPQMAYGAVPDDTRRLCASIAGLFYATPSAPYIENTVYASTLVSALLACHRDFLQASLYHNNGAIPLEYHHPRG